jgi:hypothetical protein
MDLESPAAFFRRLIARQTAPAAEDPAAMGTAFGLEASLGPVSAYFTADAPATDGGNDPAAAESPMNWLARRMQRRR